MPYNPGVTYRGGEYIAQGIDRGSEALARGIEIALDRRREAKAREREDEIINSVAEKHRASGSFNPAAFANELLESGVPRDKTASALSFYRELNWQPETAVVDGYLFTNPRTTAYIGKTIDGPDSQDQRLNKAGLSDLGDSIPVAELPGWRIVRDGKNSTRLVNTKSGGGNSYSDLIQDVNVNKLADLEAEIARVVHAPSDRNFGSLFRHVSKREKLAELHARRDTLLRQFGGHSSKAAVPSSHPAPQGAVDSENFFSDFD